MAIQKKAIEGEPTKISLEMDNGDFQALKQVISKYHFKDEEAALRFALFVLLNAEKNVVYVDEGEKKVALSPAQKLINSDDGKD